MINICCTFEMVNVQWFGALGCGKDADLLSDTLFAKVHLIPGAIPGQPW